MSSRTGDAFELSQRRVLSATGWLCAAGVLVVLGGGALAWSTGAHYWVDRSGKVLVAVSLALTYLQFRLEYRHADRLARRVAEAARVAARKGHLPGEAQSVAEHAREAQITAFERARRRVFMRAVTLAGVGELIAAFGAVAWGALMRAVTQVA